MQEKLLHLQLFAEGAEADGEGAETAVEGVDFVTVNGNKIYVDREKVAEQEETEQEEQVAEAPDYDAEFEKLIKNEYKDAFSKRIQSIIDKRFKTAKQTEERLNSLSPLITELKKRYGVEDDDPAVIYDALINDDVYLEHVAMEEGKSVKEVKSSKQQEAELAKKDEELERLRLAEQERLQQHAFQQKVSAWEKEVEKLKESFPNLTLEHIFENEPQIIDIALSFEGKNIKNPLEKAYISEHHNEIVGALMQQTASSVQKLTAGSIAAGKRPVENGVVGSVGSTTRSSVENLSKNDIYDLIKRASKGERITFN